MLGVGALVARLRGGGVRLRRRVAARVMVACIQGETPRCSNDSDWVDWKLMAGMMELRTWGWTSPARKRRGERSVVARAPQLDVVVIATRTRPTNAIE